MCSFIPLKNQYESISNICIYSICVGEHQTNNSAIFSIQHSSENTAVRNIFESLKVAKTNYLSTRNALTQLKHCHAHAI